MITHGGESFSLSFERDVDGITVLGVLDIGPTHFGILDVLLLIATGKERAAQRETKC